MKIYFEDGLLCPPESLRGFKPNFYIDAKFGYSSNMSELRSLLCAPESDSFVVYTNQIGCISTRYCWNKALSRPEFYIRDSQDIFRPCWELTSRELRDGHNLMKLYINGEFSQGVLEIIDLNGSALL